MYFLGKLEKHTNLHIQKYIGKIKELVPGEMTVGEQAYVLNSLEVVLYKITELQEEVQQLKDQVNQLQGEQGKPNIRGNNQKEVEDTSTILESEEEQETQGIKSEEEKGENISSEKERKGKKKEERRKGLNLIVASK